MNFWTGESRIPEIEDYLPSLNAKKREELTLQVLITQSLTG
jgi:hypothetical protein